MITLIDAVSGVLLAPTGLAFARGWRSARDASDADRRALCVWYGHQWVVGPALLGWLIEVGEPTDIMWSDLSGAAPMVLAAGTEWRLGFTVELRPLETMSEPVSARRRHG